MTEVKPGFQPFGRFEGQPVRALVVMVNTIELGWAAMYWRYKDALSAPFPKQAGGVGTLGLYGDAIDARQAFASTDADVDFGVLSPQFWSGYKGQFSHELPALIQKLYENVLTEQSYVQHIGTLEAAGRSTAVLLWASSQAQPRGSASVFPLEPKAVSALMTYFKPAIQHGQVTAPVAFWVGPAQGERDPGDMADAAKLLAQALPAFQGVGLVAAGPTASRGAPELVRAVARDRFWSRTRLASNMSTGTGAILKSVNGKLGARLTKDKQEVDTYLPWAPPSLHELAERGHILSERARMIGEKLTLAAAQGRVLVKKPSEPWIGQMLGQLTSVTPRVRASNLPWRAVAALGATLYGPHPREDGTWEFEPIGKLSLSQPEMRQVIAAVLRATAEGNPEAEAQLPSELDAFEQGFPTAHASPLAALVHGLMSQMGFPVSKLDEDLPYALALAAVVDPTKLGDAPETIKAVVRRAPAVGPRKAVLFVSYQTDRMTSMNPWQGIDSFAATTANLVTDSAPIQGALIEYVLGFVPTALALAPTPLKVNLWSRELVEAMPEFKASKLSYEDFVSRRVVPSKLRPSSTAKAGRLAARQYTNTPQGMLRRIDAPGGMQLRPAPGTLGTKEAMRFTDFYRIPLKNLQALREAGDTRVGGRASSVVDPHLFVLLDRFGIQHPPPTSDFTQAIVRAEMTEALAELKHVLERQDVLERQNTHLLPEVNEEWRERLLLANPGKPSRAPRSPRGSRIVEAADRYAQANPLKPAGVDAAMSWLRSGGKTGGPEVEEAFAELRNQRDPASWEFLPATPQKDGSLSFTQDGPVSRLFPRKGPVDSYKAAARIPVLEQTDFVASALPAPLNRDVEETISVLGRGKAASPEAWRQGSNLGYVLQQAQVSLVEANDVLKKQYASRKSPFAMQASTALLKDYKIRRLQEYTPQPAFFTAGSANKIVILISPPGDFPGRVMTYRGGVHLDLDLSPSNPQELGLGRLVGKALTSALMWIAEKPKRRMGTSIYVARVGEGSMTLALGPADILTLEQIAKNLAAGKTAEQRWNGPADLANYRKAVEGARKAGRKPRRSRTEHADYAPRESGPPDVTFEEAEELPGGAERVSTSGEEFLPPDTVYEPNPKKKGWFNWF